MVVTCGAALVAMGCEKVGYNVASKDALIRELPDDASDVCYCLPVGRNPNTYFEFSTSEESFLKWVEQQPNVSKVDKSRFVVYRYSQYSPDADSRGLIEVADGHLYEWYDPADGDHGEHIAYDKDTGRTYYWGHEW